MNTLLSTPPSFTPFTLNQKSKLFTKSTLNGLQLHLSTSGLRLRGKRTLCMVVKMAKREEELKEIRTKSNEQLNDEILQLKGELFMLRLQRTAREDFKPSEFGRMRKRIARMLTVKREREIEQGIGKRMSRKLDKEWKKTIVVKPPPSILKKLQEEKATPEADKAS